MNARFAQRVACLTCNKRTTRTWREPEGFGPCRKCGGTMVLASSLPTALDVRANQKAKRELAEMGGDR